MKKLISFFIGTFLSLIGSSYAQPLDSLPDDCISSIETVIADATLGNTVKITGYERKGAGFDHSTYEIFRVTVLTDGGTTGVVWVHSTGGGCSIKSLVLSDANLIQ